MIGVMNAIMETFVAVVFVRSQYWPTNAAADPKIAR
jgi:hypothetical protein